MFSTPSLTFLLLFFDQNDNGKEVSFVSQEQIKHELEFGVSQAISAELSVFCVDSPSMTSPCNPLYIIYDISFTSRLWSLIK